MGQWQMGLIRSGDDVDTLLAGLVEQAGVRQAGTEPLGKSAANPILASVNSYY